MKSINLFLPYVLPAAMGASNPVAKRAIRSAAIDFCSRTSILQQISEISVSAGHGEYDVAAPAQMNVDRVLAVFFNTRELRLVPTAEITNPLALRGSVGGSVPDSSGPYVAYFKTPSGSTFSVYPLPPENGTELLTVRAAFAPTRTATYLDDVLYEDWAEAIAAGALSILLSTPGQPFTSPAAKQYEAKFRQDITRARIEAQKGRVSASSRVRPVAFV